LKDLADAIERLEQRKLLNPEELVRNDLFVTAVVQARGRLSTITSGKA